MKVLHVISSIAPIHGGPSYAIGVIERALRAENIDVETATTDDDGVSRRVNKPLIGVIEEAGARRRYFRKSTEFYRCSWSFAGWIVAHVRDYDLVQVHGMFSFLSTMAAMAARWAKVPYVIHPLGSLNRYGLSKRRRWLKKLSLTLVEGPLLQGAAAIHFASDAERLEAETLGIRWRGEVIPLALAATNDAQPIGDTVVPILSADQKVILFLSRIDPVKNVEGLLRAVSTLAQEDATWHLVVAGAGQAAYVAKLKEQCNALGISQRVTWLGHVAGITKMALLKQAYVFVLPSLSESYGLAAAEALAAGVPCVVGRGVALAGLVEHRRAGVVVDAVPDSIAGGLREILASATVRAAMSTAAKDVAATEFRSDVMGRRLRELYLSILGDLERKPGEGASNRAG